MAISPVDVATDGYLNSPLSAAVNGYLTLFTVVVKKKGGGGQKGGLQDPRTYTVTPDKIDGLLQKLQEEDQEIVAIVMAAMEVLQ